MDLQDCINSIVEYAVYDIVNQYDWSYFKDVAYEINNWSDEDELEDNFNDVEGVAHKFGFAPKFKCLPINYQFCS